VNGALEVEVFENESRDSVANARHAAPGTGVGATGVPCCELVGSVRSGFEGHESVEIWVIGTLNSEKKKMKKQKTSKVRECCCHCCCSERGRVKGVCVVAV